VAHLIKNRLLFSPILLVISLESLFHHGGENVDENKNLQRHIKMNVKVPFFSHNTTSIINNIKIVFITDREEEKISLFSIFDWLVRYTKKRERKNSLTIIKLESEIYHHTISLYTPQETTTKMFSRCSFV
jgi:hypothetical protein